MNKILSEMPVYRAFLLSEVLRKPKKQELRMAFSKIELRDFIEAEKRLGESLHDPLWKAGL